MPGAGPLECLVELSNLRRATDEPCKPPGCGGLQARSHSASADELVDLDGSVQPLNWPWAETLHLNEALREVQGVAGHQDRSRYCHLLHPCREVRRLAHRG